MTDAVPTESTMADGKQVVRVLEDGLNRRDYHAIAALLADVVSHQGVAATRDHFVRVYRDIVATFPDVVARIDRLFAEDDWVLELVTFSGTHLGPNALPHHSLPRHLEPTGRSFSVQQAHFWRIRDGLIVEHEVVRDDLGVHRQLGVPFG